MQDIFEEPVSALFSYNAKTQAIMPRKMVWKGREYTFTKLGYHHTVRIGRILNHIFHVTDGTNDYRLRVNTETLEVVLEDVYHDRLTA
ncbi:hypothetical protein HYS00_01160 [Candidatus Microgenomates bacterium]|nr:hypothetical protein [Candidatus Microgenomates bacterium]